MYDWEKIWLNDIRKRRSDLIRDGFVVFGLALVACGSIALIVAFPSVAGPFISLGVIAAAGFGSLFFFFRMDLAEYRRLTKMRDRHEL